MKPCHIVCMFLLFPLISCYHPLQLTPHQYHLQSKNNVTQSNQTSFFSSPYKAQGIASWYGRSFHKKKTSSGDHYNMYAMTAAHRTLPLSSNVHVKNLDNGREVMVRINDRGPFRHDRLIDVSYAAAIKLGMLPKGTARVQLESLSSNSRSTRYYIQTNALNSQRLAMMLQTKIQAMTTASVLIEKHQRTYVVKAGPFMTKYMSEQLRRRLLERGIHNVSFSLQ